MLSKRISFCMVQISKPIYKQSQSVFYAEMRKNLTHSSHGLKVGRGLVLIVVGVLDQTRRPGALVSRVVNVRGSPLALVLRVCLHGLLPRTTTRDIGTLGVGDGGRNPITILLVIPILRLLGLGVGDSAWLINEP